MKDADRIQLIKLLLDEMDDLDSRMSKDYLHDALATYYRNQVFSQGAGERMAVFFEQYGNCEGPFRRDDDGNVLPGRWVEEERHQRNPTAPPTGIAQSSGF